MAVYGLVITCTHHGRQLLGQYRTHAHWIHLNEFREHLSELSRQVVAVLQHLPFEVFTGQQCIEPCIGRCIDIGRQVCYHIVNSLG